MWLFHLTTIFNTLLVASKCYINHRMEGLDNFLRMVENESEFSGMSQSDLRWLILADRLDLLDKVLLANPVLIKSRADLRLAITYFPFNIRRELLDEVFQPTDDADQSLSQIFIHRLLKKTGKQRKLDDYSGVLARLPSELIFKITDFIAPTDSMNLRMTCWCIHDLIWPGFMAKFFIGEEGNRSPSLLKFYGYWLKSSGENQASAKLFLMGHPDLKHFSATIFDGKPFDPSKWNQHFKIKGGKVVKVGNMDSVFDGWIRQAGRFLRSSLVTVLIDSPAITSMSWYTVRILAELNGDQTVMKQLVDKLVIYDGLDATLPVYLKKQRDDELCRKVLMKVIEKFGRVDSDNLELLVLTSSDEEALIGCLTALEVDLQTVPTRKTIERLLNWVKTKNFFQLFMQKFPKAMFPIDSLSQFPLDHLARTSTIDKIPVEIEEDEYLEFAYGLENKGRLGELVVEAMNRKFSLVTVKFLIRICPVSKQACMASQFQEAASQNGYGQALLDFIAQTALPALS